MNAQLPDSIATFFEVSNGTDPSALEQCFTENAVVRDENQAYQGREAIRAWLREARRKYAYTVEPLGAVQQDLTAYFSDRGRLFQADRGRRFSVIVDARGVRASEGVNVA